MKYKGTKTLEVLEGAENYNRWIAEKIKPNLKSPVLEIGAGTGNISEILAKKRQITLTDIDQELVEILRNKFKNKKDVNIELLDIAKDLTQVKNKFNSIYAVNVLEHIKNDEKAMTNIYSLLEKNGKVIFLVPAKKVVYSKIDKELGHYRRYEKKELRDKLQKAGFEIEKIEYFNIVGLLSWYVRDKIDNKNSHLKPSHVKAFDWIVPILMRLEPKKGLPLGISLIAVGVKK